MASAAVDNAKALVDEQLALLRVKLNQIPALQEVEVRGIKVFHSCLSLQVSLSRIYLQIKSLVEGLDSSLYKGRIIKNLSTLAKSVASYNSLINHFIGKSKGAKRNFGDCGKLPLCRLGLFWNWGEHPVFIHRIYLPRLPNYFGYRTQAQGG